MRLSICGQSGRRCGCDISGFWHVIEDGDAEQGRQGEVNGDLSARCTSTPSSTRGASTSVLGRRRQSRSMLHVVHKVYAQRAGLSSLLNAKRRTILPSPYHGPCGTESCDYFQSGPPSAPPRMSFPPEIRNSLRSTYSIPYLLDHRPPPQRVPKLRIASSTLSKALSGDRMASTSDSCNPPLPARPLYISILRI